MKQIYQNLKVTILRFSSQDVCTASVEGGIQDSVVWGNQ